MKKCPSCKLEKSLSEFYKNRKNSDGHHRYCKDCWEAYCGSPARKLKRNKTNLKNKIGINRYDYHREWQLKKKYGMSLAEFEEKSNEQNGCCFICAKHSSECLNGLYVDHDHLTGEVRKLLCRECNIGLGAFRENERLLISAAKYLKEHRG